MSSTIFVMSNCFTIIISILIVSIILYLAVRKEPIVFMPMFTDKPQTPKDELVEYFARNFPRLAPVLIKENCESEEVPEELMNEFKARFGSYFKNKNEDIDPMLKHYTNNSYERNFKFEIKEICKTFKSLGEYINSERYPAMKLQDLAKEIERLHSEHFPQAVFISVILDRMLEVCNKYPDYNTDQIVNTHDLLTTSVVFYLSKPTNTQ